jgi:virulence-associated protein VapD
MPSPRVAALEQRYQDLRQQLAAIGYLSHGSVYRRPAGQSGARFTWSSKVNGKTVSLALSEEQADWLDQAIAEHRKLKKILAEMRRVSRKLMRLRFQDTERRTPLNKKVLRLI